MRRVAKTKRGCRWWHQGPSLHCRTSATLLGGLREHETGLLVRLLLVALATEHLAQGLRHEDHSDTCPLHGLQGVAKVPDREEHGDQLPHRRGLRHGERAEVGLHLEDEDVTEGHGDAELRQVDQHRRVPRRERHDLRKLARIKAEGEGKDSLPQVHVEHVVIPGELRAIRLGLGLNPVLVRAVDPIAEQREQHEEEPQHHLLVELELLALLRPLAEGERHDACAEHGDAHNLGQSQVHMVLEDDLSEHHRHCLARLDQDLHREDDVVQGQKAELVSSKVGSTCDDPVEGGHATGEALAADQEHDGGHEGVAHGLEQHQGPRELEFLSLVAVRRAGEGLRGPPENGERDPHADHQEDQHEG
mmetsp:Transcript_47876/g.120698  ORF Transcript_47876/g.120698 Transcript_47876/m.120698 type:complete len:361 (+) Transcript_47876:101-1183(+)